MAEEKVVETTKKETPTPDRNPLSEIDELKATLAGIEASIRNAQKSGDGEEVKSLRTELAAVKEQLAAMKAPVAAAPAKEAPAAPAAPQAAPAAPAAPAVNQEEEEDDWF